MIVLDRNLHEQVYLKMFMHSYTTFFSLFFPPFSFLEHECAVPLYYVFF